MEENEILIDEVFDTRKGVGENKKKEKDHHKRVDYKKILIILGIILIIGIICLAIYLLTNRKPTPKENLIYTEFEPLITKLDDETYYIFGAKSNITFEVSPKDNFSYQVLTDDNTEISTIKETKDNKVVILPPSESYTSGKTYTLKITNGTFVDNNFKDAKKIVFNIARPAANKYTLKDNVITVSNPKIENNKLTTSDTYQENDIIAITNDGKLTASYKITKVNDNGTYDLIESKIDEVFANIDYYGMEKLNLSTFATDEALKNYLIGTISKSIISSLFDTVYAKESIEIKEPSWDKKSQSLSFSIIVDAKENTKLFNDNLLKNHQTKAELYINVKANLYKNITLTNYDYALSLEYTISNKANLTTTNKQIIELNDNLKNSKKDYDATWLLTDYSKITNDKLKIEKTLGSIVITTEVPGLTISFAPDFIMNTDLKGIFDGNVSGKMITTMGINDNQGIYGNFAFSGQGDGTTIGDGNITFGFASKTTLDFLNIKLESTLNSTMYIDSKSTIKEKENKDDKDSKIVNYEVKADIGYNAVCNINAMKGTEKLTKKIADNKQVLKTYQKQFEFTKTKEKKEEKEQQEFKYTAAEVKQKISTAYDELAANEEWSLRGGSVTVSFSYEKTIDVDNHKLIATWTYDNSATYTCSYDYLNKTMSCNNFTATQNYVKSTCDTLYNDYLNYLETGEVDNDDAMEWENLYENVESCYYETIPRTEPTDYKADFDKILNQAKLTEADLAVLKQA